MEVKYLTKEEYQKPQILSEMIEIGVYGQYGESQPIAQLQPFFGLCCP